MDVAQSVESIPGWLLPTEVERLHDLAQRTTGAVLEIGTYRGKSAVLMALGRKAAARREPIYTVDVDRRAQPAVELAARARSVEQLVLAVRGTLTGFVRAYPHLRPGLTFVDGDHTHDAVTRDLLLLEQIVPVEGLVVFHDYADPRNDDPACEEVDVKRAVQASWIVRDCELVETFGTCGAFRRHRAPTAPAPATIDLLLLASLHEQYLYRLRYPLGRIWKRARARLRRGHTHL